MPFRVAGGGLGGRRKSDRDKISTGRGSFGENGL